MQGWKKKMLLAGVMVGVNAFCLPVNADAVQPDAGTIPLLRRLLPAEPPVEPIGDLLGGEQGEQRLEQGTQRRPRIIGLLHVVFQILAEELEKARLGLPSFRRVQEPHEVPHQKPRVPPVFSSR